ncbi:hypothetical protein ACIBG8_03380 [Nonomuraea sp. NPDC050556]|uniref:hypothetical protein n=1 Tax=Nonomuraea sp. NPDC050556 TaxID=3364369 RepID=UPI00378FC0B9
MTTTDAPTALIGRLGNTLAGLGIGLFCLTMAAAAIGPEPDQIVWTRAGGVLAGSVICLFMVRRILAGQRQAYVRMRLISLAACALVTVGVALPGPYPAWFRAEQVVHALVLAALVYALNRPALREAFKSN